MIGCVSTDTTHYDPYNDFKAGILAAEIRMFEDYFSREILVYDCRSVTVGHVAKLSLPVLKKFVTCATVGT